VGLIAERRTWATRELRNARRKPLHLKSDVKIVGEAESYSVSGLLIRKLDCPDVIFDQQIPSWEWNLLGCSPP
jgi:hypothetical protein